MTVAVAAATPVRAQRLGDQATASAGAPVVASRFSADLQNPDSIAKLPTHAADGARIGAIVFGALGALAGGMACSYVGEAPCKQPLGTIAVGAFLGAAAGTLIGAVIGSQYHK